MGRSLVPGRWSLRRLLVSLSALAVTMAASGCSSSGGALAGNGTPGTARSADGTGTSPVADSQRGRPQQAVLRVVRSARLPAPVQLPGVAALADGTVLAVGGLNAEDASTDTI